MLVLKHSYLIVMSLGHAFAFDVLMCVVALLRFGGFDGFVDVLSCLHDFAISVRAPCHVVEKFHCRIAPSLCSV